MTNLMRDLRTIAKDAVLTAISPWMHRTVSRWVPSCPRTRDQWQNARISYSWDGEDLVAERLLRCLGRRAPDVFYVDVGCWHPVSHSNSFLFYQNGASGIAVDPNPAVIKSFQNARPRDIVVQAAISETVGSAELCCYEWDETNSIRTASDTGSRNNEFGHPPRSVVTVDTLTLAALLERYCPANREIDLLDVDCEGHDLLVLKSNNWSKYRPRVILVEAHGAESQADTATYLRQFGYQQHAILASTMIFYQA